MHVKETRYVEKSITIGWFILENNVEIFHRIAKIAFIAFFNSSGEGLCDGQRGGYNISWDHRIDLF